MVRAPLRVGRGMFDDSLILLVDHLVVLGKRRQRRLPLLELDERAPVPDQLLGERTHLAERLVRLIKSEVPLFHARMIRPL